MRCSFAHSTQVIVPCDLFRHQHSADSPSSCSVSAFFLPHDDAGAWSLSRVFPFMPGQSVPSPWSYPLWPGVIFTVLVPSDSSSISLGWTSLALAYSPHTRSAHLLSISDNELSSWLMSCVFICMMSSEYRYTMRAHFTSAHLTSTLLVDVRGLGNINPSLYICIRMSSCLCIHAWYLRCHPILPRCPASDIYCLLSNVAWACQHSIMLCSRETCKTCMDQAVRICPSSHGSSRKDLPKFSKCRSLSPIFAFASSCSPAFDPTHWISD